jgi:hypothetical protein
MSSGWICASKIGRSTFACGFVPAGSKECSIATRDVFNVTATSTFILKSWRVGSMSSSYTESIFDCLRKY